MPQRSIPTVPDTHACLSATARRAVTSRGEMEYAERGEGPPLLSVHGSPGGYEQGLLFGELFRCNGFRVIAPSRPGYGGTALATGRTPVEQADAVASLLDALGIERVGVFAMSGGGPAAYLLAVRHPDRVVCLLQVDAISRSLPGSRLERLAFSKRPFIVAQLWLLDHLGAGMLKATGGSVSADPAVRAAQIAGMRNMLVSASDWPNRREGYDNDEAAFAALGDLPLRTIGCPTLIVHGSADRTVPYAHAQYAHASIEGSRLHRIVGGRHVAFFVDADAQRVALDWLVEQLGRGAA